MPYRTLTNLLCPLCHQALSRETRRWVCSAGHSFDIARQGYVHLLPVQSKRSKDPGDSREMVAARRAFLDSGVYQPLARAQTELCLGLLPDEGDIAILDAGCGDGYYLEQLCQALTDTRAVTACGLDISKWAVRVCRSRHPGFEGVVASNRQLPFPRASQDLLLCNFGFPVFGEFQRVVKPGGAIVLLDAGEDHLLELRQMLYPEIRRSPPPSLEHALTDGWQLVAEQQVQYRSARLSQEQLQALLLMTPHFFRSSQVARHRMQQIPWLAVTVSAHLRVLQKVSQ